MKLLAFILLVAIFAVCHSFLSGRICSRSNFHTFKRRSILTVAQVAHMNPSIHAANVNGVAFVAYDSIYDQQKESLYYKIRDSSLVRILDFWADNEVMLGVGGLAIAFVFFAVFGRVEILMRAVHTISNQFRLLTGYSSGVRSDNLATFGVDNAETLECEGCHTQLRPAKGRAAAILSAVRFRCVRCGAKGSSFFNIDDGKDPRAIARKVRLEKEALLELGRDENGNEIQ
jgi:hypothetical protein